MAVPGTVLGRTAAGLLVALAGLTVLVRVGDGVPGDAAAPRLPAGAGPRAVAVVVDRLTGYAGTAVLTGFAVLLLVRLGRRRDAVLCAVSVGGALVGNTLLKQLVGRPRPDLLPPSVAVSPLSFPSGHAAAAAAVAVAVVLAVRHTRALVPAAVGGALLVLAAAAAQLVLGLHRTSDVVAGWLLAAAWTTAVWAAADRRAER